MHSEIARGLTAGGSGPATAALRVESGLHFAPVTSAAGLRGRRINSACVSFVARILVSLGGHPTATPCKQLLNEVSCEPKPLARQHQKGRLTGSSGIVRIRQCRRHTPAPSGQPFDHYREGGFIALSDESFQNSPI